MVVGRDVEIDDGAAVDGMYDGLVDRYTDGIIVVGIELDGLNVVGFIVGAEVGNIDGRLVGIADRNNDGAAVGNIDGRLDGGKVGNIVGFDDGNDVDGHEVVDLTDGNIVEGGRVGSKVGSVVVMIEGSEVGVNVAIHKLFIIIIKNIIKYIILNFF